MKKIVVIILLLCGVQLFLSSEAMAQKGEFRFYYVMKDSHSYLGPLVQTLREEFNSSVSSGNSAVFFLPNGNGTPTTVTVNLSGDNRNDFDGFIQALSSGDHTSNGDRDIEQIIRLFDKNDFLNSYGSLKYKVFELYVYVTPSYELREDFIPRLYFALDLDSLPEKQFLLRILSGENDVFEYDEENPFGSWGVCHNYLISTY